MIIIAVMLWWRWICMSVVWKREEGRESLFATKNKE